MYNSDSSTTTTTTTTTTTDKSKHKSRWFYTNNGKEKSRVSLSELLDLYINKEIDDNTYVWHKKSVSKWTAIKSCPYIYNRILKKTNTSTNNMANHYKHSLANNQSKSLSYQSQSSSTLSSITPQHSNPVIQHSKHHKNKQRNVTRTPNPRRKSKNVRDDERTRSHSPLPHSNDRNTSGKRVKRMQTVPNSKKYSKSRQGSPYGSPYTPPTNSFQLPMDSTVLYGSRSLNAHDPRLENNHKYQSKHTKQNSKRKMNYREDHKVNHLYVDDEYYSNEDTLAPYGSKHTKYHPAFIEDDDNTTPVCDDITPVVLQHQIPLVKKTSGEGDRQHRTSLVNALRSKEEVLSIREQHRFIKLEWERIDRNKQVFKAKSDRLEIEYFRMQTEFDDNTLSLKEQYSLYRKAVKYLQVHNDSHDMQEFVKSIKLNVSEKKLREREHAHKRQYSRAQQMQKKAKISIEHVSNEISKLEAYAKICDKKVEEDKQIMRVTAYDRKHFIRYVHKLRDEMLFAPWLLLNNMSAVEQQYNNESALMELKHNIEKTYNKLRKERIEMQPKKRAWQRKIAQYQVFINDNRALVTVRKKLSTAREYVHDYKQKLLDEVREILEADGQQITQKLYEIKKARLEVEFKNSLLADRKRQLEDEHELLRLQRRTFDEEMADFEVEREMIQMEKQNLKQNANSRNVNNHTYEMQINNLRLQMDTKDKELYECKLKSAQIKHKNNELRLKLKHMSESMKNEQIQYQKKSINYKQFTKEMREMRLSYDRLTSDKNNELQRLNLLLSERENEYQNLHRNYENYTVKSNGTRKELLKCQQENMQLMNNITRLEECLKMAEFDRENMNDRYKEMIIFQSAAVRQSSDMSAKTIQKITERPKIYPFDAADDDDSGTECLPPLKDCDSELNNPLSIVPQESATKPDITCGVNFSILGYDLQGEDVSGSDSSMVLSHIQHTMCELDSSKRHMSKQQSMESMSALMHVVSDQVKQRENDIQMCKELEDSPPTSPSNKQLKNDSNSNILYVQNGSSNSSNSNNFGKNSIYSHSETSADSSSVNKSMSIHSSSITPGSSLDNNNGINNYDNIELEKNLSNLENFINNDFEIKSKNVEKLKTFHKLQKSRKSHSLSGGKNRRSSINIYDDSSNINTDDVKERVIKNVNKGLDQQTIELMIDDVTSPKNKNSDVILIGERKSIFDIADEDDGEFIREDIMSTYNNSDSDDDSDDSQPPAFLAHFKQLQTTASSAYLKKIAQRRVPKIKRKHKKAMSISFVGSVVSKDKKRKKKVGKKESFAAESLMKRKRRSSHLKSSTMILLPDMLSSLGVDGGHEQKDYSGNGSGSSGRRKKKRVRKSRKNRLSVEREMIVIDVNTIGS